MSIKRTNSTTHIHWFIHDLRLTDQSFTTQLDGKKHFLGVYILDPRLFEHTPYGFRRMSLMRLKYLRNQLHALQEELRKLGSDLLVRVGYATEIIPELLQNYNASLSVQRAAFHWEKIAQQKIVNLVENTVFIGDENHLIPLEAFDWTTNNFPKSFTGFRKKAEKYAKNQEWTYYPKPQELPDTPKSFPKIKNAKAKAHALSVIPFSADEQSALARLNHYFFESKAVSQYKETRNGLLGTNYSSKFSVFLANGSVSPRTIMHHLKKYEAAHGGNESTYWLWFELLWREYFQHAASVYGAKLFLRNGIVGANLGEVFKTNTIKKWQKGETPDQFVNANMKELENTGFMSNRGRQNVASFLIHDLKQPWWIGAAWFENQLLDFDAASNYGNWQYIAGVGFNPKGGSRFNTISQAAFYDPNLEYVNKWSNQ